MNSRNILVTIAVAMTVISSGATAASTKNDAAAQAISIELFVASVLEVNKNLEAAKQRWMAAERAVPIASSLSDPMVMLGYKNDGFEDITYGEMEGSEWMVSVSQAVPFWGKRSLRDESARAEADALAYTYNAMRLDIEKQARFLYLDIFLTNRAVTILSTRMRLIEGIERAALNRYSTGMTSQAEVVMVQSEKYMILERLEMLNQRGRALGAAALAMMDMAPGVMPWQLSDPVKSPPLQKVEYYQALLENSPMVQEKKLMLKSGASMESLAQREFYPDFTLSAQVNGRPEPFTDMWQVSVAFNIPLFVETKQRAALSSATLRKGSLASDLDATINGLQAALGEAHAMALASEKLMDLYEGGFISKSKQSFDSTLTAYSNGKIDIMALLRSLSLLTDYEISYWEKFVQREKAIAEIAAITSGGAKPQADKNE